MLVTLRGDPPGAGGTPMRASYMALLLAGSLLVGCGVPQTGAGSSTQGNVQGNPAVHTPIASIAPSPTAELAAKGATGLPGTPTPVPPTATLVPTVAHTQVVPTATPVSVTQRTITIDAPLEHAAISSPVTIQGSTDFWPFEATLVGQVKDAQGHILGVGPITVAAPDIGHGGPFEAQIEFEPPATDQIGTLEVFEASAKDGSIVVMQTVTVQLDVP